MHSTYAQALPIVPQPRAKGAITLSVKPDQPRARLADLHQVGSLRALFPRVDGMMQAVLVNTSGGITGGDAFDISARVQRKAQLTLTTQAAERAYRAQPGSVGQLHTQLHVEDEACLNWLPQETILFEGCNLNRHLQVDLAPSAQFTMVEPLVIGRTAMGETVERGQFNDRIRITRAGRDLFHDATRLGPNIAQQLQHPTTAGGAKAMALVLHVSPHAPALLPQIRALLPDTAGASVIGSDLLVMRALAQDAFELRRFLIPVLTTLTEADLPRPWLL